MQRLRRRGTRSLSGFLFLWGRSGGFGLLGEQGETGGVLDGHVREDFAVEVDTGGFKAVDQLTIGQAVETRSGADALVC